MSTSRLESRLERRIIVDTDLEELNKIFSSAFTDRYRRDGMVGVRVPQLNPDIWRYAIRDAGDGALLWHDDRGKIVAFNLVHRSGVEGWMGPLAVRPDRQGEGIGKAIVEQAVDWLRLAGADVIGLETMPRTVDNIGFYGRLGFSPGYLTISMGKVAEETRVDYQLVGNLDPVERDEMFQRCMTALVEFAPGFDFTRELELTEHLAIGDTIVVMEGDRVRAWCLCHSAALAIAATPDELRLLKVFANSIESFTGLMLAAEDHAARLGLDAVSVRCQSEQNRAFRLLIDMGYRVKWTDLRMMKEGNAEAVVDRRGVVMSNWEI
ncbi:MAG: GNAT family N-acetyltransferase [Gemmatimonadales bacterium]